MRERISGAKRVVVKVGTSTLTDADGRLDAGAVERLAVELCEQLDEGREMVCVTSGAIAAGLAPLKLEARPRDMPTLQAAAAVGQSHLMDAYASAFEARGRACGQVLLTRGDFVHRGHYVNALNTFQRLIALGAVPVVNENDSVGTEEIRFGENDLLAALVANLVRADLLVLLSDVDGLHDGPGGEVIDEVEAITPAIEQMAGTSSSSLGSGGMRSKLDACRIATASGVGVVIARSRTGALARILGGEQIGTVFGASATRLGARRAWIAYATVPAGRVIVDAGARRALTEQNRSLLAAGVKAVEGSFAEGDAVEIVDDEGKVFARGLVAYPSHELERIAGWGTERITESLGSSRAVVHRDELAVL